MQSEKKPSTDRKHCKTVTAVVLNWNNARATIRCAESLLSNTLDHCDYLIELNICIVDNGSEIADLSLLEEWLVQSTLPNVSLIRNDRNLGFAKGMNVGIREFLCSDYVWALNNDASAAQNAIVSLVDFSDRDPDSQIVGSIVYDDEHSKKLQASAFKYYPSIGYARPIKDATEGLRSKAHRLSTNEYIDGCAIWMTSRFLQRVGGIPECSFLYFEELNLRAALSPGEYMSYCSNAVVYHRNYAQGRQSDEFTAYNAALSAFIYTLRFHPWYIPTVIIARLFGVALRSIVQRNPEALKGVVLALKNFLNQILIRAA